MKKEWPLWVMLWLAGTLIICWIITVCAPGVFWKFLDIILWIFLVFSWISAVINSIKNQQVKLISILFAIWVLMTLLWFLLIFSGSEFVGKLTIWMFALWALMRWLMLIFFSIQNKETQTFWWAIMLLWWILVFLAIMTAVSKNATNFAWVCIWISIIFDGISLLFFALRWGNVQTTQAQIITQAEQNEIAQWDVVVTTETVVISNNPNSENKNQ